MTLYLNDHVTAYYTQTPGKNTEFPSRALLNAREDDFSDN